MDQSLLSEGGLIFIGIYICSLLLIGYLGKRASKEQSLNDFYLAGRNMGVFVLFLTLYATQYSGNTLIGFAGRSYRQGFTALVCVTFMISVIGAYLIFAPKLYRLSRKHNFITIGDYIQHRFNCRIFTTFAVILCIIALGNYILTNLKAIGYVTEILTDSKISFATGIIALSVIMVIYETLGGLRSVAWTDVIQGLILLGGLVLLFVAIEYQYGGVSSTSEYLINSKPEFWRPPDGEQKVKWASTILIVFLGISIYPQAIQRIYAAKSENALRYSFKLMAFMPFITSFIIVMTGVIGISLFPDLDRLESESIVLIILEDLKNKIPIFGIVLIIFMAAVIAAIMSTIDSALLAISSLFTQDIYRLLRPGSTNEHLTFMGKLLSWVIIAVMCYLAIKIPQTIWKLFEIKIEMLCQVAPAIFLGILFNSIRSRSMLYGITAGSLVTFFILFNNMLGFNFSDSPFGIHAGLIGFAVNLAVIFAHHSLTSSKFQREYN